MTVHAGMLLKSFVINVRDPRNIYGTRDMIRIMLPYAMWTMQRELIRRHRSGAADERLRPLALKADPGLKGGCGRHGRSRSRAAAISRRAHLFQEDRSPGPRIPARLLRAEEKKGEGKRKRRESRAGPATRARSLH